jgi:hypothetical protein
MPQFRRVCVSLAAAALVGATAAAGQPSPSAIKPEAVGRAARFAGPLVVREEDTGEISKDYGRPLWAATVAAPDESFADLNVVLVEGGSFLTPAATKRFEAAVAQPPRYAEEMRREIVGRRDRAGDAEERGQAERELQELDRLSAIGPLLRPVRLLHDRRGYSAVLGFSRIEVTFATILPSPDGRYDLIVSLSTPFESGGLTQTPEAARYQSMLQRRPLDTLEPMALAVHRQLFPPQREGKAPVSLPATPAKTPLP